MSETELPTLEEVLQSASIVHVEIDQDDWTHLTLSNGFEVMFQPGVVIVHPDRTNIS